ncbi:MAG: Uma2 family endonuclease [Fimbriimonadales bacterium]
MATTATAPKTTRQRRTKQTPAHPTLTPNQLQDLIETLERLKHLDLPEEDGEPLESDYHVMQIPLLDAVVRQHLGDTQDYFCGGNMFIYYSLQQAQEVSDYVRARTRKRPSYKGPDFFLVKGVDGAKRRDKWVVWEEGGKYPDLVVEIISPSTASKDKRWNVRFYARVFRTPEYFWYDPYSGELRGYRLSGRRYRRIAPDARGWLWSEVLGAWLGVWEGVWHGRRYAWLRLYDKEGRLVPTPAEYERARAEQERQRAEAEALRAEQERQRAEQSQAELEQLKAKLRELGVEPQ